MHRRPRSTADLSSLTLSKNASGSHASPVAHVRFPHCSLQLRPLVLLDAIVAVHPASAPPALEGAQHTAVGTWADATPAAAGAAVELHTPVGAER